MFWVPEPTAKAGLFGPCVSCPMLLRRSLGGEVCAFSCLLFQIPRMPTQIAPRPIIMITVSDSRFSNHTITVGQCAFMYSRRCAASSHNKIALGTEKTPPTIKRPTGFCTTQSYHSNALKHMRAIPASRGRSQVNKLRTVRLVPDLV